MVARVTCCRVMAFVLAMLLAAGGVGTAKAEAGWADIADTIFRPAVPVGSAPGVLLPTAIVQDRTGFLWSGGEGGLARWDGYNFRLYVDDDASLDGLPDHNVLALHVDAAGHLWAGTLTGGLARYDEAADRFQLVALGGGTGPLTVWSLDDDGAGGLWVAASTGLFHLDAGRRTVASFHHEPAAPAALPLDKVESVLRDRHGTLWVGGVGGLARAEGAGFSRILLPIEGGDPPEVTRLMADSRGRLWIGTRSQGAYVLDGAGPAARIAMTVARQGQAVAAEILAIAEIAPGTIWLSTGGSGIVEVAGAGMAARIIRHDPLVAGSLSKNTVSALFRDRSGLVWAGTVQGLCRYDPGNAAVLTLQGDPGRRTGLRLSDISAVLARPDGSLWVGSDDNGLQILDPSGRQNIWLSMPLVFALAPAADGPVYVGTRAGLFTADASAGAASRIDWLPRPPDAPVNALLALDGTLWLGGGADGLWALRETPGRLEAVRHLTAPALTSDTIDGMGPAPGGKLAVGTNRGFNLVDPASGAVERIFPDPSDPQGLSQGGVMSFAIDRHQRLWVGTDDAGIDVMTGRDRAGRPRFRHVGKADGLPDLDISKMMVDRLGRIWASTDHGLAVLDPDDFSARPLQAPQGVMVTSYWSTSGDQAANGDMIFGGAGGLTIVRPEQVSAWSFRPTVAITGVKLGGQALAPDSSGWKRAGARLEVPPDGNSLAVEFSALDFSAPELNRYAYRLDGFDTDWIETDAAHRVAAYTNLPPGQYTLRLRGSNREGLWSNDNAPLHIRVLPAWFQTGLFRAVVALAVILAVGALVQARTVFLRQRQRALERQVAERTAALRASQQELQAFAYLDTLTGLPNRRAFNEEFAKLIDAGGREAFALLLVDLDGFKTINDHLGHQAGDAVLAAAAARIRHAVRAGDFIARLGGDEFAIVMRGVEGRQPVNLLCERVVSGMAAPLCIGGSFVTVGASIGAALFPVHGRTQDELYRHVDLALYDAKRTGRGVWCWFDSGAEVKQEALF
jgi:diguanylate cyclase (GGDEF)-like protein